MCIGKRGLKFNANKSEVKMLGGEEGVECQILVIGNESSMHQSLIFGVCFGSIS